MIDDGLWLDRRQRQKRIHQPRSRRDCVGELVQVDGSEHWWFEDRGPQCTLLVFVDDATSRLMHLQFVESELTFAYFHAARAYLEAWGKPIAFYSDKHGVFRVNHPGALGGDGMTQFGRALHALNIDIICANSSPAKGVGSSVPTRPCRIGWSKNCGWPVRQPWPTAMPSSRPSWLTTTRALPKRRRTARICTGRCAPGDDLDDAFAWKEERTLSRALTLQYDKVAVHPGAERAGQGGDRQAGHRGRLSRGPAVDPIPGIELAYRTFDKIRQVQQATIVENKQLGAALTFIREKQLRREPDRRSRSTAPARSARCPVLQSRLSLLRAERADTRSSNNRSGFERSASGAGRTLRYAGAPRPPAARPKQRATDSSKLEKN